MTELNIISYNIKGLGHPVKRKKILSQLKSLKCSVALLQETHLNDLEHKKLKREWINQIFFASCPKSRKRGVAILIHRSNGFTIQKEVKDPQGRYIGTVGTLLGIEITILNIYAPNEEDPSFFTHIASILAKFAKGMIILGGDFNCVLDRNKDRLPPENNAPSRKSKAVKYLLQELGLVETWRALRGNVNDFTFFSNVHRTYSRIDMICISRQEINRVTDIKIEPITLSDHAPVKISLNLYKEKTFKYWRLNVSMLSDEKNNEQLTETIEEYFQLNDNGSVSPSVLWDGAKAVLQGRCIQLAVQLKKQRIFKQSEIEGEIRRLEQLHKASGNDKILLQLKEQ